MATTPAGSRSARGRSRSSAPAAARGREAATRELSAGEIAWLLAAPCALVVAGIVLLLGPSLGTILSPQDGFTFWTSSSVLLRPEPTEHARYLLALTAPVLLAATTLAAARRRPQLAPATIDALVHGAQAAAVAVAIACVANQHAHVFGPLYISANFSPHTVYFSVRTIAVALAIAAALAYCAQREDVRARVAAWTAETRTRWLVASLLAVLVTAISLMPALHFDDTIAGANPIVLQHVEYTFDETYAVLDGRSPLVDFAAQYGSLWPYLIAALMTLLGTSIGVLSGVTSTLTVLALLGLFGLLRRVARSSVMALLLFLPLLATSLFVMRGPLENRYSLANVLGAFPLRYAGPLLLAWLLARHLDGAWPRRSWVLFLVSGLAMLNNADFGVAAFGATVAALLWVGGRPTRAGLARLGAEAAAGLVAALVLVTALTLLRTGSAPDLGLLFRYSRLFALGGFGMLPMEPIVGIALLIYLTYVAAIGTATVRAIGGDPDRLLTGLLVWSGIFGLGVGSYYMGRSHPEVLTNMFPAWGLSLTLLTVVSMRSIASGRARWPALPQLACLVGFGVMVCSLAQTPTPWSQVDRLQAKAPPVLRELGGERFVAAYTQPGEPVVLLTFMGHRLALNLKIDNVSPYTASASIATAEQLDEVVDALRDAGGRKAFFANTDTPDELVRALEGHGFKRLARDRTSPIEAWIDRR